MRFSHDFEDFIYVLNNRRDIIALYDNEQDNVLKEYLSTSAADFLIRPNCHEEIECMLPYGEYDRTDYIIEILKHFRKYRQEC